MILDYLFYNEIKKNMASCAILIIHILNIFASTFLDYNFGDQNFNVTIPSILNIKNCESKINNS